MSDSLVYAVGQLHIRTDADGCSVHQPEESEKGFLLKLRWDVNAVAL